MATIKVDRKACDRCQHRGTEKGVPPRPLLLALWNAARALLNRKPVEEPPELCGSCNATLTNQAWRVLHAKEREEEVKA